MKLVLAIVSNDDGPAVLSEATRAGFSATKLTSSGGFLRAGNVTVMFGIEDGRLQELLDLLRNFCSKRTQITAPAAHYGDLFGANTPVEITAGGATVFVIDVEQFLKM